MDRRISASSSGSDAVGISAIQQVLRDSFKLKELGALSYFLGLEIERTSDGIFVSQRKYIKELLILDRHDDSKPLSTPMELNLKLSKDDGELLPD
ncbi:Retrovirus-related Pol polyprotein from transposon RE2, partial [Linum grandiflorum]